jgi:Fur family peroxide stress response transcriptional regulator
LYSDERVEAFRRRLASQGQRVTPQRLAIYKYLIEAETHPSAEEIHRALQPIYPSMSPATVYKTLELLVEMGLATELAFGDSPNRYDGNPHEHVNLVCTECGSIVDLEESLLEELRERVVRASRFLVRSQRHEFHGVCPRCQNAKGA